MPTVLRIGPYIFLFFSSDYGEPPHIHIQRDKDLAKFWLTPISCAYNKRFPDHELNKIEKMVIQNSQYLLEKWHEYFNFRI